MCLLPTSNTLRIDFSVLEVVVVRSVVVRTLDVLGRNLFVDGTAVGSKSLGSRDGSIVTEEKMSASRLASVDVVVTEASVDGEIL